MRGLIIWSLKLMYIYPQSKVIAKHCPTKRALDAGESAAISSSFLRLILFQIGRLRAVRPSASNANR